MPVDRTRASSQRTDHRVRHEPVAHAKKLAEKPARVDAPKVTDVTVDGFAGKPASSPTELPIERTGTETPHSGVGGTGALRFQVEARLTPNAGPAAQPLPEVAQLLATYGIDLQPGRPRERFLTIAARLHNALTAADAIERVTDPKQWSAIRGDFFALEGLLRLYHKQYGEPIDRQLDAFKAVEDWLGGQDYYHTLHQLSVDKGFPPAVQEHLANQCKSARDDVVALMRERWTPAPGEQQVPGLRDLIDTLARLDWQDDHDDRKTVRKALHKSYAKLAEKQFDLHQLQGNSGLHELRRALRWTGIQAPALGGLIAFDDARHPIPEFKALLDGPVAQSKYSRLPVSDRESEPLRVSRSMYLANTDLIDQIGTLKNDGEAIEGMAQAWFEAMIAPTASAEDLRSETTLAALHAEAESKAMQQLGASRSLHDIANAGAAIYQHLQEIDYFATMAAEFEKK